MCFEQLYTLFPRFLFKKLHILLLCRFVATIYYLSTSSADKMIILRERYMDLYLQSFSSNILWFVLTFYNCPPSNLLRFLPCYQSQRTRTQLSTSIGLVTLIVTKCSTRGTPVPVKIRKGGSCCCKNSTGERTPYLR